jgi:soluble lytic murein transglycosylase-like protein
MVSLRSVLVLSCITVFGAVWSFEIQQTEATVPSGSLSLETAPPCIKLYDLLKKYSDQYDVPFGIAYGVAATESGYRGPFDWDYDPKLKSGGYAYGAMQVQVATANLVWNNTKRVKAWDLLNDLDLNVETSMRALAHLKKTYGTWEAALGCYNTGQPIVNYYALEIIRISKRKDL